MADDLGANWARRVWQTDDGLPAANVTGIAQTKDGLLWFATQSGLAQFDGVEFEVVPVPVGRAQPIIRVMLCDHAENFWLAEDSGVIVRFGKGAARMFTTANGLSDSLALQLIETPDHNVWVCYADGSVFRITPDYQITRFTSADGLNEDGICSLTLDARGVLCFVKGFQFGFYDGKHFQKTGVLTERNAQILGARNGDLWFCTSSQILKSTSNSPPVAVANFDGATSRFKSSVLFEDFNARLWIGTAADGLFLLERTNLFKIETSQNKIRTIMRDREGSIWVGTDGGGVNRMLPKVVELHGRDEGLPFDTVRSLCEDRAGDLWVVTQDGTVTRLSGDDWSSGEKIASWPGGLAHCVVADQSGALWFGTYQRGLLRWQDGKFTRFGTADGLGGMSIRSLMVDSRNDLWIGLENDQLVQRLHDGKFQTFKQPPKSRAVRAMAEDASGNIWLGTLEGRLLRVDGDQIREVEQATNEPLHHIRCMKAMPDDSVWVGYAAGGVGRWKAGRFSRLDVAEGLFDGNICALIPDDYGRMWFAADRGIFYVSLQQLNDFADDKIDRLQSIFYGRDAGLPSLQAYYGYWPGATVTKQRDILFPTHSGIAVVHPKNVRANVMPPNVLIRRIAVDGQTISRDTRGAVKVTPGHRKVEVTFTAPSFIAPERVRFRYRLAGWDEDWTEAKPERLATFNRLPAGDYTFQVTACNNNGVWNEKGDSVQFTVTPFFWQSGWFRTLLVLALLVLVVVVVRHLSLRRARALLKRVEQESVLQQERTRIAQDMHDELGARFTQISLLGALSSDAIGEPEKARDFLGQISRVAQVGVKSLDEIVWAVNPRNDALPDLLDYTGQYARDFITAAGLQCRLDFPDAPPARAISGDIRHAVFLIVKEALHNVVKHAQATHVKIIVEVSEGEMTWRIEDDGKGFEPAPENALEDGLRNIRQRASALGGHAEIISYPGQGTQVLVKIPLPK